MTKQEIVFVQFAVHMYIILYVVLSGKAGFWVRSVISCILYEMADYVVLAEDRIAFLTFYNIKSTISYHKIQKSALNEGRWRFRYRLSSFSIHKF